MKKKPIEEQIKEEVARQLNYLHVVDNTPKEPVQVTYTTTDPWNGQPTSYIHPEPKKNTLYDNCVNESVKASEVDRFLNELSERVSLNNHLLEELTVRLHSILPQGYPESPCDPKPQREVPLVNRIDCITDRVNESIDKVNFLINNVAV